jgi:hypothetical protein
MFSSSSGGSLKMKKLEKMGLLALPCLPDRSQLTTQELLHVFSR